MALKLKSRKIMAQPRSYLIAERAGGVRYKLSDSQAAAVPLGRVISFDPELLLIAGDDKTQKQEFLLSEKRDGLKERIVQLHGYKDFTPENIMFTNGTYEANFLVLSEAVDKGDEVVVIRPCWYQFASYQIEEKQYYFCCGGLHHNAKVHLLTRKEDENWRYDVEDLKEVVTSKTAVIVVNSPDNPTGNICTPEEMRAICEIAEDYGAYVLHDEIYRGTEWDRPFSSPKATDYYEKSVATNSLSKSIGWDGVRIGWLATRDKKLYERCRAVNEWLHMGQTGAISNLQLEIGYAALERKKFMELLEYARNLGKACWDEVDRWMTGHKDIFNWIRPMGAFLSFPSYNLNIESWEFSEKLAAQPYSVGILPGIAYGMEKHLRLGVGRATPEDVKAGLEQVDKFLSTLKSKRSQSIAPLQQ